MSFESSTMQWMIPVVALGLSLVFALDIVRRRRALERVGHTPMIERMTNSLSTRRRIMRSALFILAMVLLTATLARPTSPGEATWRQRGIDIAFVYDFSASMLAKDVYPNRLDRSLKESENLIARLKADRIATVVFAGGAVHFPLTHDHVAARLLYQGLRPSDLAPGSDLGQALRVASCALRADAADPKLCAFLGQGKGGRPLRGSAEPLRSETPSVSDRARAIVLFTDGEDSEGFALREAERAAALGITLYVIGVGTRGGELVPSLDDQGNELGWQREVDGSFRATRLDAESLRAMATAAKGRYFSLGEGRWRGDLVLESLKELKRGELEQRVVASRNHIFERFLFPAFLLLIMEACMSERRRRTHLPVQEASE